MPLVTNVNTSVTARQQYKQEITLLSHGYINRTAFPDGKITVYPWDSDVDEWFTQRLRKGQKHLILFELTEKLCDLNGCDINEFVLGDMHTVMLVARSIIHKNQVKYTPVCSRCGFAHPISVVSVPDELEKIGEKGPDYPGYDTVSLPESHDVVKFRPLQVKDEITIENRTEHTKKMASDNVARILIPIISVGNGQQEGRPDSIQELLMWWQALHPRDRLFFTEAQDNLYPHLNQVLKHVCDNCQSEFEHPLNLDLSFFRGGSANLA
jgi:hypothetical protein